MIKTQSNYISLCKIFRLFYTKNLLFLFYTITFTKHPHQFIYYTHFFIKIIFSLTFFLLFLTYPHLTLLFSLNNPFFFFFTLSLSLSPLYLCPSFFSNFFFFFFFFFLFFENIFPSSSLSTHHKHSINTLLFPLNNPFFTPSLSLYPPLFLLLFFFFFFGESFSFLFSINPLHALHQHRSPSTLISVNPSPISIKTDPYQPITDFH